MKVTCRCFLQREAGWTHELALAAKHLPVAIRQVALPHLAEFVIRHLPIQTEQQVVVVDSRIVRASRWTKSVSPVRAARSGDDSPAHCASAASPSITVTAAKPVVRSAEEEEGAGRRFQERWPRLAQASRSGGSARARFPDQADRRVVPYGILGSGRQRRLGNFRGTASIQPDGVAYVG